MDSTLLMTGDMNITGSKFFSIKGEKLDDAYVSDYLWTGYCLGGCVHNPLFDSLKDLLFAYWSDHDRLIDYFILDYFIRLVYDFNPAVKQVIDSNPANNPDVAFLQQHFDDKFCEDDFRKVCKTTALHKLSWKGSPKELTPEGELTYYGYILSK